MLFDGILTRSLDMVLLVYCLNWGCLICFRLLIVGFWLEEFVGIYLVFGCFVFVLIFVFLF